MFEIILLKYAESHVFLIMYGWKRLFGTETTVSVDLIFAQYLFAQIYFQFLLLHFSGCIYGNNLFI